MTSTNWDVTKGAQSIVKIIQGATYGPLVKLGNKLRAHPENAITSYKNIAEIVASKPSVAPFVRIF